MRARLYSTAFIAASACAIAAGCELLLELDKVEFSETGGQGGSTTQGGGGTTTSTEGGGGTTTSMEGGAGGSTSTGATTAVGCEDRMQNGTETDTDCGGDCMPCALGQDCLIDVDCQSASCADGVCCDGPCNGLCEQCDQAGMIGTCMPVPAGEDPDGECSGAFDSCDGQGACALENGQSCSSGAECVSGQCADDVCCDAPCSGLCESCNQAGHEGTCRPIPAGTDPIDECPVGGADACNGAGACGGLGPNGATCLTGMEAACESGYCVDGFCCNIACTVKCTACKKAWTNIADGLCGAIVGKDPRDECPGNDTCLGNDMCGPPN